MSGQKIAIVDYELGNLFSVANACEKFGMTASITSSKEKIWNADAVILPGVGAFGDAMESLKRLDLIEPLKEVARSGTPFIGICLGMQLLMTESFEFGHHQGLGLIPGKVIHFENLKDSSGRVLKVPEVQWNQIRKTSATRADTLLEGVDEGEYMYFVHSYYCIPRDKRHILSVSRYGNVEYCSTVAEDNVLACQYHPEKSGRAGLEFYKNLASMIEKRKKKNL